MKCTTLGSSLAQCSKARGVEKSYIVSLVAASDRASVTLGVTSFERVECSGSNYSEGSDLENDRRADIHGLSGRVGESAYLGDDEKLFCNLRLSVTVPRTSSAPHCAYLYKAHSPQNESSMRRSREHETSDAQDQLPHISIKAMRSAYSDNIPYLSKENT